MRSGDRLRIVQFEFGVCPSLFPDLLERTTRYDVAEHLRTPKEMAAYLEACFEEANGDAAFIAKALGDVARAKGMSQVARDAGLSRESLYKALSGERAQGSTPFSKLSVRSDLRYTLK
jgi:probable addiction module antidote protein